MALGQMLMNELERQAAAPEAAKEEAEAMRREIVKLDRETARLVTAVAEGTGDVAPLADAIRSRQQQKADLQAKLEHLDGLQQAAASFDVVAWIEETAELLADTRDLLEADPVAGRHLLRGCLVTPLKVTPDGRGGWDYEAEGRFLETDLRKVREQLEAGQSGVKNSRISGHFTAANPDPLEVVPPG